MAAAGVTPAIAGIAVTERKRKTDPGVCFWLDRSYRRQVKVHPPQDCRCMSDERTELFRKGRRGLGALPTPFASKDFGRLIRMHLCEPTLHPEPLLETMGLTASSRGGVMLIRCCVVASVQFGGCAWAQTVDSLPPIAGPSRPSPPAVAPYEPSAPAPPLAAPYRLPPPVPFPATPDEQASRMPPAPSAQKLQARDEPIRLQWRIAIEAEFGEWWQRYGCFPHPGRQEDWFYQLADRLNARDDREPALYELVMERVNLYGPPEAQFSGLLGGAENWVNGLMGWRAPGDLFCPTR